ncbi:MAG: ABC transporter substrate-binding protein, partial [Acidimicrobiia bacterium]
IEFPTDAEDGPLATFAFDRSQLESTIAGLFEYFSDRFQLYGRRFEPVFFEGQGDFVSEFGGAGQEGAEADAVKVAEEIKPFAELLGLTTPFSDALARRQVVNMGALFMSREWYQARSPYVWTSTPDCTFVLESASDYLLKRVIGRSAAHAGGDLAGTDRKLGVIAPDNPWFQECVDAGMEKLEAAGAPAPFRASYRLDFNQLSNQAASLVAKLRDAGVTTVVCGCDPALPIFLTSKAHEQGYQPEWILIGAPFSDTDVFGQSYQQDQWSRAFGLSFTGTPRPTRATHGYHAFKAARPNEEPIELVDYLYHQMYVLALGVHMAGPNLTPETFRDGLYAWAGGSGAAGTWRFDPGRHTPTQDAREIYWDREATSPHNGKPGTYIETEPGRRYRPGQWRREDPPVFRSGDRVPAP